MFLAVSTDNILLVRCPSNTRRRGLHAVTESIFSNSVVMERKVAALIIMIESLPTVGGGVNAVVVVLCLDFFRLFFSCIRSLLIICVNLSVIMGVQP